jgi:hypothetical protein
VASTSTPNDAHFLFAGGSWSHALGVSPCESVRLFPPPGVLALVHLRLGVDGNPQRGGVVLDLLPGGLHVNEDGVGLLGLLQRLGLLNPLEPVAQAVEDVAQGPLAGQLLALVAFLGLQRLEDLGGGQVGVAALGLQFRVGLGVWLDEVADVLGALRLFLLPAGPATSGEVLDTADALPAFVQALADGVAPLAEAPFRLAGVAAAQLSGDLGLEQAALVPLEVSRRRADQLVVGFGSSGHQGFLRYAEKATL